MPKVDLRTFRCFAAGLMGLAAASCGSTPRGVEVYNDTGEIVRAELFTVNPRGETSLYSTAIVNREAIFENRMEAPVRGQIMRARFTLADQPALDFNRVELKLPTDATRTYSLRLVGGLLRAQEFKTTRPREGRVNVGE